MAVCLLDKLSGMPRPRRPSRIPSRLCADIFGNTGVFACRGLLPISKNLTQLCLYACLKLCVIQLERFCLDKVQLRSCACGLRHYPSRRLKIDNRPYRPVSILASQRMFPESNDIVSFIRKKRPCSVYGSSPPSAYYPQLLSTHEKSGKVDARFKPDYNEIANRELNNGD